MTELRPDLKFRTAAVLRKLDAARPGPQRAAAESEAKVLMADLEKHGRELGAIEMIKAAHGRPIGVREFFGGSPAPRPDMGSTRSSAAPAGLRIAKDEEPIRLGFDANGVEIIAKRRTR